VLKVESISKNYYIQRCVYKFCHLILYLIVWAFYMLSNLSYIRVSES
jgi:hypothetical protein